MISAILTDIEGTTSSIRFVKETLFPYAAEQLPSFLYLSSSDQAVRRQLDAVANTSGVDKNDLDGLIRQLLEWIAADTKATPLKALQGMVWKHGYERGDYQAHFYPDAVEQMKRWKQQGMPIFVYSSGSVQAQQLFFKFSCFGDLSALISGWFDTNTGAKQEADSYRKISAAVAVPAADLLFLSDVESELDAATQSGLPTVLVARADDHSGENPRPASKHPVVDSFDQLEI